MWPGFCRPAGVELLRLYAMSTENETTAFGTFIHNMIPEDLRVDPFASEVRPHPVLDKSSFSLKEYLRNNSFRGDREGNQDEQDNQEGEENDDVLERPRIVSPLQAEETVDNSQAAIIEEVDDVASTPRSVTVNSPIANFGSFMYDIYQSASFAPPMQRSNQNRMQYVYDYYRRMVNLLQSTQKPVPASEEVLSSLLIVRFH